MRRRMSIPAGRGRWRAHFDRAVIGAYWLLAGYGLRAWRSLATLAAVVLGASVILWKAGFRDSVAPTTLWHAGRVAVASATSLGSARRRQRIERCWVRSRDCFALCRACAPNAVCARRSCSDQALECEDKTMPETRLDTSHHDRRLARRLQKDPEFRREFERQRREIAQVDSYVRRERSQRDRARS